jgi:hypothetical protein
VPIYLDQVVLQYWFQGPQQAAAAAEAAAAAIGADGSTSSRAAQADAAQLYMTCTDAQAPLSEWTGMKWLQQGNALVVLDMAKEQKQHDVTNASCSMTSKHLRTRNHTSIMSLVLFCSCVC